MAPRRVPPHVFAVDGRAIQYGFFPVDSGQLVFQEYHREPLPDEVFNSGPLGGTVRDVDQFLDALSSLCRRISTEVTAASLVVPDRWLRVAHTELETLPRGADRNEALRFKLKRLVPFRVEELRIDAVPSVALGDHGGVQSMLLGFGIEALFAQLEDAFRRRGIRVGHLSNHALSLLSTLAPLVGGGAITAVFYVNGDSYSMVLAHGEEPLLHRFKQLNGNYANGSGNAPSDLRLTRNFVDERLQGKRLAELVLAASAEDDSLWSGWLEEAFELPVRSIHHQWQTPPGDATGVEPVSAAVLAGAAARRIQ